MKIQALPIDKEGNLLFLKNFRTENNRHMIDYRSMLNDIPFTSTELYWFEESWVITGDNGKVIYRIHPHFINNLLND